VHSVVPITTLASIDEMGSQVQLLLFNGGSVIRRARCFEIIYVSPFDYLYVRADELNDGIANCRVPCFQWHDRTFLGRRVHI
jgi:hypothetical protein